MREHAFPSPPGVCRYCGKTWAQRDFPCETAAEWTQKVAEAIPHQGFEFVWAKCRCQHDKWGGYIPCREHGDFLRAMRVVVYDEVA